MNASFFDNDEAKRAADRLQRYFEGTISPGEADALLVYWQAHPEFDAFARKNRDVEQILRFFSDVRKQPLVYAEAERPIVLKSAVSPFSTLSPDPTDLEEPPYAGLPDLDELIRLAMTSRSLPREPSDADEETGQKVQARKSSARVDRPLIPLRYIFLLMLAFFVPSVYREFRPVEQTARVRTDVQAPSATIVDLADVRWEDEKNASIMPGTPLYSNRLHFRSGTLELLFFDGVRCTVEGPADVVLIDRKQVFARQGSFSVDVPKQAKTFEIQTPRYLIRDLGTRFHAEVVPDGGNVQVLQGKVEVEESAQENDRKQRRVLEENQAIRIEENGRFQSTAMDLSRYVSNEEMRRRSTQFLKSFSTFFQRPATEDRNAVFRLNLDRSYGSFERIGGRLIEGRIPGKQAFQFVDKTDRIRLKSSGRKESLTGIVWLRIDRLHADQNPILMSEGAARGGIVWKITGKGSVMFGWRHRKGYSVEAVESPVVVTDDLFGHWIQLAFSYDSAKRITTLYLNGRPIALRSMTAVPHLSLNDLDLGNWKTAKTEDGAFQPLDGAVAEFELFEEALASHEIRAIYELDE